MQQPHIRRNHVASGQAHQIPWHKLLDRDFLGPGGCPLQLQTEVGGQARGDVLVGIMAEHCGGGVYQPPQPLGGTQRTVFLGKAQADTEENHGADDQRRLAVAAQQGEGSHGRQQGHQRIAEGGQQLPEPGNRLLLGDLIGT